MPKIIKVRPVLLSAPYAHSDAEANMEVRLHLPSGLRTTGLVEITLDNGVVGLGEGYLAVFAPHVFTSIVDLLTPLLLGRDPGDLNKIYRDLLNQTGYWSLQGAAQHVVSAVEIALQDCRAQLLGQPLWRVLGATQNRPLHAYASGGDSVTPAHMQRELEEVAMLGIDTLKIRARKTAAAKARWCQREGARFGISIAVDMTQNLVIPSQTVQDVLAFLQAVEKDGGKKPVFIEEVLGPDQIANFPALRKLTDAPVAGGEVVTTARELCERVRLGYYGIVQPDATVIGGITSVMEVFSAAQATGTQVYVHCWGGPVGMLANYHAALAGNGDRVEWPLPHYPLREAMWSPVLKVTGGKLKLSDAPGLGAKLTPEIEREFPFREEAVYRCLVDPALIPMVNWP